MMVKLLTDHGRDTEAGTPDWRIDETWPDAERCPGRGELVRLAERTMRVIEVGQSGPRDVFVYLVPASSQIAFV